MPILQINGQRVQVSDDFLSLPRPQQDSVVNEIASHPSFLARAGKSQAAADGQDAAPRAAAPQAPTADPAIAQGAAMAGMPVPEPSATPGETRQFALSDAPKFIDNLVRQAADGMTFGLADRAAAAGNAALGSGDYASNLKTERGRTQQFAEEHPAAALGAQLVGGAMTGSGAARGAKALLESGAPLARAAGAVLSPVTAVGELESPLARTLGYAGAVPAEGFGYGAANAAGHADNATPDELATKMLLEGGAGALFSSAVGLPMLAAGGVVSRIRGGGADAAAGINPTTGKPFTKAEAALAARATQDSVVGAPADVAAEIGQNAKGFRDEGLPVPTAGALTRDLGMRQTDATLRSKAGPAGKDILQRDAEVATAARDQLESAAPAGADPQAALDAAKGHVDQRLAEAQMPVDQAQSQLDLLNAQRTKDAAEKLGPYVDGRVAEDASGRINDAYSALRDQETTTKRALYNDQSMRSEPVDKTPVMQAAADLEAKRGRTKFGAGTAFPDTQLSEIANLPPGERLNYGDLQDLRTQLSATRAQAVKEGNGPLVTNTQRMLDAIDGMTEQLAQQQTPAGLAAQRAKQNYAENFAPNFREGVGGQLDRAMRAGNPVRPSDVGRRYTATPEDAARLERLTNLPNAPKDQMLADARAILWNDLASRAMGKDGTVNPDAVSKWMLEKGGVLDPVGMREPVLEVRNQSARGKQIAADLQAGLKNAQSAKAATEKEVEKSAAGLMLGKDADHAVQAIMGGPDPGARMAEAVDMVKDSPAAKNGLKAAFKDWMVDKFTGENTSKTLDGRGGVNPSAINKFWEGHREIAAKLFSPDEMNAIQRAHKLAMTEQARNIQKTSGSPSAERLADQQADDLVSGVHLLPIGLVGKGMALLSKALSKLPNAEAGAKELQVRALLDPETIQYLLNRDTKSPRMPSWIVDLAARAAVLEPSGMNDLRRDAVPRDRRLW